MSVWIQRQSQQMKVRHAQRPLCHQQQSASDGRERSTEDMEDADHAMWGCNKARERWMQLETDLEVEWHLEGLNWERWN